MREKKIWHILRIEEEQRRDKMWHFPLELRKNKDKGKLWHTFMIKKIKNKEEENLWCIIA